MDGRCELPDFDGGYCGDDCFAHSSLQIQVLQDHSWVVNSVITHAALHLFVFLFGVNIFLIYIFLQK